MPDNELSVNEETLPDRAKPEGMTREQINLIKATICKGASDDQLALFLQFCRSKKIDPFSKQLYAILRQGVMSIQTGIDGFRAQAGRSSKYAGQLGPFWCGPEGHWLDVWLDAKPPVAAKVGVLRHDFKEPCWGVARFAEYNAGQGLWQKMPATMIAKCAEALALRKAFPDELSGMYAQEEMDQAIDVTPTQIEHSARGAGAQPAAVIPPAATTPAPAPAPMQDLRLPPIQPKPAPKIPPGMEQQPMSDGAAVSLPLRPDAALQLKPDAPQIAPKAATGKPHPITDGQRNLVWARARKKGLAVGDNCERLISALKAFGIADQTKPGRTYEEVAADMIKLIPYARLTEFVKLMDATPREETAESPETI